MDQICPQFLHVFSVNLGVIPNNFFVELFCVMYAGSVFYGNKKNKDSFLTFFVFCLLQNLCLPILTISLQVNFYQIDFIN